MSGLKKDLKPVAMNVKLETDTLLVVGNSRITPDEWQNTGKIEIFDVNKGSWNLYHDLGTVVTDFGAANIGDDLIIIGGNRGVYAKAITSDVTALNLKTLRSTTLPSMNSPREYFSVDVIGDNIYVCGGYSPGGGGTVNSLEVWNPSLSSWHILPPMNVRRSQHASAVLNEKIYIFGGWNVEENGMNTVEYYDTKTLQWFEAAPMSERLHNVAAITVVDKIYVIGGISNNQNSSKVMHVYHPGSNTWVATIDIPYPVNKHAVVTLNNKIYISGGQRNNETQGSKDVYEFDPVTAIWKPHSSLLFNRYYHSMINISMNSINPQK